MPSRPGEYREPTVLFKAGEVHRMSDKLDKA
jgi:hypothetical protein